MEPDARDEPEGAVRFFGPYDQPRAASLKLSNSTRRPIVFRLKCSNPLDFNIAPSGVGLLRPSDTYPLTLIALLELDRSSDCTLILEFASVDPAEGQQELDAVTAWSRVKLDKLARTGIKTVFGPDARADEELETTVIVINESMLDKPEEQASVAESIRRIRNRNPDCWRLLWLLAFLALISFLCGMWVGSRTKNGQDGRAEPVGLLPKNETKMR